MENKYKTEKKNTRIQLLTAQKKLADEEIARKQLSQIGWTLIFILLLLFILFYVVSNRKKMRLKEQLLQDQMSNLKILL